MCGSWRTTSARALHAGEDSFTHTLRTPDMHGIVHVMNYAEAVGGTLEEERDGLAHSSARRRLAT
jgi:hypothetical protein